MDAIKKSHYTQELPANGSGVGLRFEGIDGQRLRAQKRERLDGRRGRREAGMKSDTETLSRRKQ